MTNTRGMNEARWIAVSAVLLVAAMLAVLHLQKGRSSLEQLQRKARRLELANEIRANLISSSQAERGAVMAITDEDSQKFADQARTATATAEQARAELEQLLHSGGNPAERDSLSQFSQHFAELQRIDKELLTLAVKNTNLKASALAFGPAAAAIKDMDAALVRLPADDAGIVRHIDDARIAVWRSLASLPPHIAEESDEKMKVMEAQMAAEDRAVRRSLDELSAQPKLAGHADLKAAMASYEQFDQLRTQILKLSRENTNIRSLTVSLTQKRAITALCQEALAGLQQAIQDEPITGISPGKEIHPR